MSEKTEIPWCDSTNNFHEGCDKVSPGCTNCYAEARDRRQMTERVIHWGKGAPRRKSLSAVKNAFAMNRKPWICDHCGTPRKGGFEANLQPLLNPLVMACEGNCNSTTFHHRRRIFSLSLGDWLDDEVPIEWLAEMLDTIRQCDQVTWMLCSKRWEDFEQRMSDAWEHLHKYQETVEPSRWVSEWMDGAPPKNIIGLCSVENQEWADKRLPVFHKIPLACHALSMEPLLGPITLQGEANGKSYNWLKDFTGTTFDGRAIDWIICGGESGPSARPCNIEWIRDIVRQGKEAGVSTFVKQLGAKPKFEPVYANVLGRETRCEVVIRDKKGGDPSEWPTDLRIREFPRGF